jgi:hypothetical protein
MSARQCEVLEGIVEQYLGRVPEEFAERERKRLAGVEQDLHFAWAGKLDAHNSHYYRIEGPRLLIEYDNFHRDGNHIHSVWRDPLGDFGRDSLREHIARDH